MPKIQMAKIRHDWKTVPLPKKVGPGSTRKLGGLASLNKTPFIITKRSSIFIELFKIPSF